MKTNLRRIGSQVINLANEVTEKTEAFFTFANASMTGESGWVQLTPFGRFKNAGGMQEVKPEDVQAMVNEFQSMGNLPQRVMGLPWYIGHPDHPSFRDTYKDTRAYGRIKGLEARHDPECQRCAAFVNSKAAASCAEHGLFANVKWSEPGKKLIESEAFHGHSVNWFLQKVGQVFRPFSLKSVGFTNEPNIPVPAIMSANERQAINVRFKRLAGWRVVAMANAGDFDESLHPRDQDGKFAEKEGGGSESKTDTAKETDGNRYSPRPSTEAAYQESAKANGIGGEAKVASLKANKENTPEAHKDAANKHVKASNAHDKAAQLHEADHEWVQMKYHDQEKVFHSTMAYHHNNMFPKEGGASEHDQPKTKKAA